MKSYYRIMLGKKSKYAQKGFEEGFIGADYGIALDLSNKLPEDWRAFNKEFIPVFMANNPGKTKIAAGLACGMLWTIAKGIQMGDIVLCPDGIGTYHVGEITSGYFYQPGDILPHRRSVRWLEKTINRADMSDALQHSTGSIGMLSNISAYGNEIEGLIGNSPVAPIITTDETIEDPATFAMEKHLEEFLVQNWSHTAIGKDFDIYKEDNELVGEQYPTDTGTIDILAISHDKKKLLVVELKRGRASDSVVGQIQRYMGYVKDELAEAGQQVHGVIIAMEDDQRIRRALSVAPNIEFYRYEVSFKLIKG